MSQLLPTLICLGLGLLFLVVEIFTPGLGVAGLLGVAALLGAVLLQIGNPVGILFMIALVLFIIALALLLFLRLGMKGKFDRSKLVLGDRIEGDSTGTQGEDYRALKGKRGVADTVLRPAGKATIAGRAYDVVTSGDFVLRGREIEVMDVEGARIVVRAAAPETSPQDAEA